MLPYTLFLCFDMLFVYVYIKCKIVSNTFNFDKDARMHMTNLSLLAIKENMRYDDAG